MVPNCLPGRHHVPLLRNTSVTPTTNRVKASLFSMDSGALPVAVLRPGLHAPDSPVSPGSCCFLSLERSPSHPDLTIPQDPGQVLQSRRSPQLARLSVCLQTLSGSLCWHRSVSLHRLRGPGRQRWHVTPSEFPCCVIPHRVCTQELRN